MSWSGTHAITTTAEARRALPAKACRHCVQVARLMLDEAKAGKPDRWSDSVCTRCGVNPAAVVFRRNG